MQHQAEIYAMKKILGEVCCTTSEIFSSRLLNLINRDKFIISSRFPLFLDIEFLIQGIENQQVNPLSANPTKWLNTLKQFVGKLPTNCLVFDHFVEFPLKGLMEKT